MSSPAPDFAVTHRLDELEVKASFAEDQLDQLNLALYRQQQQIDGLQRQIELLRAQLQQQSQNRADAPRDPRDELPPHY